MEFQNFLTVHFLIDTLNMIKIHSSVWGLFAQSAKQARNASGYWRFWISVARERTWLHILCFLIWWNTIFVPNSKKCNMVGVKGNLLLNWGHRSCIFHWKCFLKESQKKLLKYATAFPVRFLIENAHIFYIMSSSVFGRCASTHVSSSVGLSSNMIFPQSGW